MRSMTWFGAALVAASFGFGSLAHAKGGAVAPKGEDIAKRYLECWSLFNSKDWDKFKTCYAAKVDSQFVDAGPPAKNPAEVVEKHAKPIADAFPDIKGDVELTLINGANGATFALMTGTQTGTLKTPMGDIPPSNKKIGLQVAHVVHMDSAGAVDKEWFYQDIGEMLSQLGLSPAPARPAESKPWGPNETVVAKNDETEKRNLGLIKKETELFNKHDSKAMGDTLADDVVWAEIGVPKDWNKQEALASHEGLFKGFGDLKITTVAMWAAGDYVVQQGVFAGTNTGAMPEMGLAKGSGKKMSLNYVQLWKLNKDGKITLSQGYWNSALFAQQLGLVPPPPAHK